MHCDFTFPKLVPASTHTFLQSPDGKDFQIVHLWRRDLVYKSPWYEHSDTLIPSEVLVLGRQTVCEKEDQG